jgi:hypothetical protein
MPSARSRTSPPPPDVSAAIERRERAARLFRRAQNEDSWCHAGFAGCAFLVVIALLAIGTPVTAQQGWTPHVRPEAGLRELVAEATRRSPAIRALVDGLERLDITVYVRMRIFAQTDLDGRVALLTSAGSHRFLVVELACGRSGYTQMTTLAHELFHATEIATEPSVVDTRTMAAYYARIGIQTGDSDGKQTFETQAAADAGRQARRELLMAPKRHVNGT